MNKDINELLHSEKEQLQKLKDIVTKTIEDENLILEPLLNPPKEILSRGDALSDKVARFGGSWAFIITFFGILVAWIIMNTLLLSNKFDPYPFILMNLILSCIAAIQAPIIMMSQNRQEEKDRKRSVNDYMVNLKAELEIRALHQKIDLLMEDQIKILFESQAKQLDILNRIMNRLDKMEESPKSKA